jgi:protein-S-isoprenylcysteine O-methyltransferase Ste14
VSELALHSWGVWAEIGLGLVTFVALVFVSAPYGRHSRGGWGPTLPVRWGWVLMELPCVVVFAAFFFAGQHSRSLVPLLLLGFWQLHYLNRTFVFPFRLRVGDRRMPLLIPLLAIGFNVLNAWINARWIGHLGTYSTEWLSDPRFVIGALMFLAGWAGNLHSDALLRRLRKPGETGYKIPRGGLYRWVSAPNYLCEIIEWCGWAVMTWSPAGLAFALYTAANLAPRALSNHRWYLDKFEDYPSERKALIPFVF